jgi:A/G-specific adenine glycosylase
MRKRKPLAYGLARKEGTVLLVQRPADASLMVGMWELPIVSAAELNGDQPLEKLRHSITDTDYNVSVFAVSPRKIDSLEVDARWFTQRQWERLPLTGLARKILRRLRA